MRLLVVALLGSAVTISAHTQTTLCDEMARAMRRDAALMTGASARSVLETLTRSVPPTVSVSAKPDFEWHLANNADESAGIAEFRKRHRPSAALTTSVGEFSSFGGYSVYSISRNLNVMVNVGGTAGCESFHFFRVTANGDADVLEGPALRGNMDYCIGGTGRPAWIAGRDVFLGYFPDPIGHDEAFRVIPLSGTSWERGCNLSTSFEALPFVSDATPFSSSGLTQAQLEEIALRINRGPAVDDGYGFIRFGRSSADGDAEKAGRLRRLALTFNPSPVLTTTSSPLLLEIQEAHAQFIVVDGRTLVTVSGQARAGWRTFREFVVVVFDLIEDAARPIGVARIATRRGRLLAIDVTPAARRPFPRLSR